MRSYSERHRTPAAIGRLRRVEVFVDEYGDRGFGLKASPMFAMTAVMVPEESVNHMRAVAGGLRSVIRTGKPLHWVEHFTPKPKHAERRALAAEMLAGIPGVVFLCVVADKATLEGSEYLKGDEDHFYNYVTKLLLERVAFQAKNWPGGARMALARLSSIRGTRERDSIEYLEAVRDRGRTTAPLQYIKWPPHWYGPERYDGLQIADLYTGIIGNAISGAPTEIECAAHLLRCRHQLRRGPRGQVLGWGVKVYGRDGFLTERPWWPLLTA
ncbi:MAG TPA: DUF3800 domain-containing protein [Propionicimonas sp.]|jgi:hypothetical protein